MLYLRLSVAQDHLQQYPQALDSANKAVQYAKDGSAAQNLAQAAAGAAAEADERASRRLEVAAHAAGCSSPSAGARRIRHRRPLHRIELKPHDEFDRLARRGRDSEAK